MDVHLSTISALTLSQFAFGILTGIWPSFKQVSAQATELGASGLQVSMLYGWKPDDCMTTKEICAVEGPWYEPGDKKIGWISKQLFGEDGYDTVDRLVQLMRSRGYDFVTVDMRHVYPDSLLELADLPGRRDIFEMIRRQGRDYRLGIVYDTWHMRELMDSCSRNTWMLSNLHFLSGGDVFANVHYYEDQSYRVYVNQVIDEQLEGIKNHIKMFQVQTRSKVEAKRFVRGDPTMLGFQVALIAQLLYQKKACGEQLPKVVVECMPWWTKSTKREFVWRVKEMLKSPRQSGE